MKTNYYPTFHTNSEIEGLLRAIEEGETAINAADRIGFDFADREWFIDKNSYAELSRLKKELKALSFE